MFLPHAHLGMHVLVASSKNRVPNYSMIRRLDPTGHVPDRSMYPTVRPSVPPARDATLVFDHHLMDECHWMLLLLLKIEHLGPNDADCCPQVC